MKVKVYGATWCAFCKTEKQWLDSKNVAYEYYDVDTDEKAMDYLKNTMQSTSVPVTVILNEDNEEFDVEFVRGFDRKKLSQFLNI